MEKTQRVGYDFLTYTTSAKIDRNGAAQLIFYAIDNGGTLLLNGTFTEEQLFNGWAEPINNNEASLTDYNVVITGDCPLIVVRKYYLNK